jgi:hypothetical protein
MFGGVAFLLDGNMAVGLSGDAGWVSEGVAFARSLPPKG